MFFSALACQTTPRPWESSRPSPRRYRQAGNTRPYLRIAGRPVVLPNHATVSSSRRGTHASARRASPHVGQALKRAEATASTTAAPVVSSRQETTVSSSAGRKFDLPLAVALAGCAFESYSKPTHAEGLQEVSVNGTQTTYIDRMFLKEMRAGVLKVHLKQASDLPACNPFGTSDPYCIVTTGQSFHTSSIKKRTLEPTWDESFFLYVRKDDRQPQLTIKVMDEDFLTGDDAMGHAVVPLSALSSGAAKDLDVKLEGPGGGGRVQLSLQYLPMTDEVLDGIGVAGMSKMTENLPAPVAGFSSQWRELATTAGRLAEEIFDPVCFIDNKGTDTQVWLFRNVASRCLVVAFRGTESVQFKDLLTDALLIPAAFSLEHKCHEDDVKLAALFTRAESKPAQQVKGGSAWEAAGQLGSMLSGLKEEAGTKGVAAAGQLGSLLDAAKAGISKNAAQSQADAARIAEQIRRVRVAADLQKLIGGDSDDSDEVLGQLGAELGSAAAGGSAARRPNDQEAWVHRGFLTAYNSVRARVTSAVEEVIYWSGGADDQRPWQVYVTGHSLGGALSTLSAYELALHRYKKLKVQPAITMYNYGSPRVGNAAFVTAFNKAVPDGWRVMSANDVVTRVPRVLGFCHVDHAVRVLEDGSVEVKVDKPAQKPASQKLNPLAKLIKSAQTLVSGDFTGDELDYLAALKDGSALEEHMEPHYFGTLRSVVASTVSGSGGGRLG